ncbi:histone deacetylase family protein [Pleionea sediminis]|uniref:histone deacetylase family protein n=1 Tax=Pleionea sediminis TaxID=2569479 RepID=UPI0011849CDB|nr:histone deacetylase family protein [Pleionea sediminis]
MYFISHPYCKKHEMGPTHPESPARLSAIEEYLKQAHIWEKLTHITPLPANEDIAKLAHSDNTVTSIVKKSPSKGYAFLDGDTQMNSSSLEAAYFALGSGVTALKHINNNPDDQSHRYFCAVRPPGHHAERDRPMGFCIFNTIAVTALLAVKEFAYKRVVIIDFDVHHGNGTEDIVANHSSINLISTFQHPLYPGTGIPASADNIHNIPLPAGTGSNDIRRVWEKDVIPRVNQLEPDLILVSAGFDAHSEDPLASLNFEDSDYEYFGTELTSLAKKHCHGRLISFLEGGYNLEALGRSCTRYIAAQI